MLSFLPIVTVVTATFKKFDKIYETIDSVLLQDYPNIEFILSDDASDDFPEQAIKAHIESHKRDNLQYYSVLRNDKNVGTVKHLNMIYKKALGKYIVNLSGDDIFFGPYVIKQIVMMFEKRNCNVLATSRIVCTTALEPLHFWPYYLERKIVAKLNTPKKQYKAFVQERFFDMASGSAVAFKKDVFEKYGYYDESYRLLEDAPFFARFTREEAICFAHDIVSIYYRLGGVSNKKNPDMSKDRIHYNEVERVRYIDDVDWLTRDYIRYINKRYIAESKLKIFCLYLRYPIVVFTKAIYKLKRRYYASKDRAYLQNFLEKVTD